MKSIVQEIKSYWKKLDRLQKLGMLLKKERNGIVRMVKILGNIGRKKNITANNVLWPINQKTKRNNIVQTIVNLRQEDNQEWTMSQNNAQYAKKNLPRINTVKESLAHMLAVDKVEGKHDVYNLTVDEAGLYFANGMLVSNCDSIRYLILSVYSKKESLANMKELNDTLNRKPQDTFLAMQF
jgi:hypothetical protein